VRFSEVHNVNIPEIILNLKAAAHNGEVQIAGI
jgi:hypothetical protein